MNRTEVVQFRVFSEWVVEPLDIVEYVGSGLSPDLVNNASAALSLQRREEALHSRVVPKFTTTAHAAGDVLALQSLQELVAGVLAAPGRSGAFVQPVCLDAIRPSAAYNQPSATQM